MQAALLNSPKTFDPAASRLPKSPTRRMRPRARRVSDVNAAVLESVARINARSRASASTYRGAGDVFEKAGQFSLGLDDEIRVDLFCGGGGASEGIEIATGEPVHVAVNHDPAAIAMHTANHPGTRHFTTGVQDVCPRLASAGRPVGHLHASPDCFPAGTMVLTSTGYRSIETLAVGDLVLTHKNRWRRVTATMSRKRKLLRLVGHGHPGLLVSGEHPFLAKQRSQRYNDRTGQMERSFGEAEWVKAADMKRGMLWATPASFESLSIPEMQHVDQGVSLPVDERLLWLAGRYFGDGWTRLSDTRAELVIVCGAHEAQELGRSLDQWPRSGSRAQGIELAWTLRSVETGAQFSCNARALVVWLREHFGHGAADKRLPGWLLSAPRQLQEAFMSGYLGADGWSGTDRRGHEISEAHTVSKAAAFGLKALLSALGYSVCVYLRENNTNVIQGRSVNARPLWQLRWRSVLKRTHSFEEDGHRWSNFRGLASEGDDLVEVFNVSVDEDESYVADGIVVHNCTHFSQAKGGQPRDRAIRSLAWVVLRWAGSVRPRFISMENVIQMTDWGRLIAKRDKDTGRVLKLDGTVAAHGEVVPLDQQFLVPDPKHRGKTFARFVRCLEGLGYTVEYRALVAADFGAPTTRERLYLIARCDGLPLVWPKPTHFRTPQKGQQRWRGAHECIDWTIPAQSIFGRKKDLVAATLRRTARGIQRFVIDTDDRFIVPTEAAVSRLEAKAPVMIQAGHGEGSGATKRRSYGSKRTTDPLGTVTASGGGQAMAVATLIQTGFGERKGQLPRVPGLDKPLGTVVAGGSKHAVVTAYLAQANDGFNQTPGHDVRRPMTTITNTGSQQQLITASLVTFRHYSTGIDARAPLPTVAAGGEHHGIVECVLSTEEHAGALRVAQFMRDYLTGPSDEPLVPITVQIDGVVYAIVDICLRMLQPKELFAAQGFPANYVFDRGADGKPLTKTQQIRMCGNSVSPVVMAAIVAANDWRDVPLPMAA